ncbi:MAG: hypothetical protein IT438_00380 [Phycisphaerales bacterium]|nr:hypothetical protein [Phycisphaerales bacterium]
MTAQPPNEQLFTVRVAAPPPVKGTWKVLIRAADRESAAAGLVARGHLVLEVNPGSRPVRQDLGTTRVMPECAACGYPLKDLPPQETLEITCPECGTINLGIELPLFNEPFDPPRVRRLARLFVLGAAGIVLLAAMLVLIW